jgi:hypothetical protein
MYFLRIQLQIQTSVMYVLVWIIALVSVILILKIILISEGNVSFITISCFSKV